MISIIVKVSESASDDNKSYEHSFDIGSQSVHEIINYELGYDSTQKMLKTHNVK